MINKKTGEKYVQSFPKFNKWIAECNCCHTKGYDPSMTLKTKSYEGLGPYFIKKYYNPLELDEYGICSECSKVLKKNK